MPTGDLHAGVAGDHELLQGEDGGFSDEGSQVGSRVAFGLFRSPYADEVHVIVQFRPGSVLKMGMVLEFGQKNWSGVLLW